MAALKELRITDPYVVRKVEELRVATGDTSGAKTAGRLLLERIGQLELSRIVLPSTGRTITDHDVRSAVPA